jgi:homopolymeric O-antigen transport system permease protein
MQFPRLRLRYGDMHSENQLRPFSFGHGASPTSVAQYVDLTVTLTQKEIKIRYKNNFLGYFWSLVNPLASAMIIFLAIQVILHVEMENYVVFLITGLFAWQWFNNYLIGSCTVFLSNSSLIKKCLFPRFVLPIALNLQDTFHYAMSIPFILGFVIYHHLPIGPATLLGILAVMPAQFLLLLGFGLILSSANLFLRDIERIVMILLNMMFYVSPILYPIDLVPEPYRVLLWLNPMTSILEAWHGIFLDGTLRWNSIAVAYVYAAIALFFGILVYRSLSSRFAEAI